eukprot:415790_1
MENKYDEEPLGNDVHIWGNSSIVVEEVKENTELDKTWLPIDNKNTITINSAETNVDDIKYLSIEMVQHNEDNDNHHNTQKDMDALMVNINDFVQIQVDDYNCGPSITQYNAMKRILHLLKYYKNVRATDISKNNESVIPIYEYLKKVSNNHEIANVMDDWHHVKKSHLQNIVNIEYFDKYKEIICPNKNKCIYFNRHHRDRNREVYDIDKDIDHKNLMLMDQLDSIHSYIFHTSSSRIRRMQNQYFMYVDED